MEDTAMPSAISNRRILVRFGISLIIISGLLFGSAGTVNWLEAWLYIILQFSSSAALAAWLKRNNPDLLKERMTFLKRSAKGWDKAIILAGTVLSIPFLLLVGLDAVRYHWSSVSWPFKVAGFVGISASFALTYWVMRENTYLSRVVEIQKERGHKVITTGPYQFVRHPMYVGVILLFLCLPLALGSLWALIPGALLIALIIVRAYLEDNLLHKELEGYTTYAEKVRYRILPGIW